MTIDALATRLRLERSLHLSLRVRPGARVTKFREEMEDGSIKIDLAAPPEDGKANQELTLFLADTFAVPRSHVEIVTGATSRLKQVRIYSV